MYTMRMLIPMLLVLLAGNIGCTNNPPPTTPPEVQAPVTEQGTSPFTDLSETTDLRKLLCQNWEHKEDAEDAEAGGSEGSLDMPYRGIALFDDGTVTENPRDKIRFGKWTFD